MTLTKKFLIQFGVICLLLGSMVFVGQSVLGIMVDFLQGVLYVASGLFAFAAVMLGQEAAKRYALFFGFVYALIFFVGVINHGFVLLLFRTDLIENLVHLIFAGALLAFSVGEESLARWFAAAKRWA